MTELFAFLFGMSLADKSFKEIIGIFLGILVVTILFFGLILGILVLIVRSL